MGVRRREGGEGAGEGGDGMENAEGEEEIGEEGRECGASRHFFFSTLRTAGYSSCCEIGHAYTSLCYLGQ